LRGTERLPLTPKGFDLLWVLAESGGRAMSRDELVRVLWREEFVEEANLSFQISALRKALGEEGAKYIETVPKHGYRFICPVVPAETKQAKPRSDGNLPNRRRRSALPVAAALCLVGALGAVIWIFLQGRSEQRSEGRSASVLPLTSYSGYEQQPSFSPDGSQVAFSWDGQNEDNFDIYVKLVGPGEPVRLTTDAAPDQHPAWSPDGRYIAFLRYSTGNTASILLIPALGGAERKVADVKVIGFVPRGTRNLSWSADGKHLALGLTDQDGFSGIWAISVDTGERQRLTTAPPRFNDYNPVFSVDSQVIAFIRAPRQNLADVYVQRLGKTLTAVGEPRRVTFDAAIIQGLAWMPKESKLIYSTRRFTFARLRVMNIESQDFSRRPETTELPFGEGATALSVSPGGRLVYARQFRDSNIWKVQISGGRLSLPTRLVASTFDEAAPDYSTDGKRIAFASTRSGFEEIWTAEADGSKPSELTSLHAQQTANPRWSPDGKKILFNSWDTSQSDLWTVDVKDGTLQRLTNDPENQNEPHWSRNGKWIYYSSDKSGRYEIYRMPAEGGAGLAITRGGGINPVESHDALILYYAKNLSSPNEIWRVPATGGHEEKVTDGLSDTLNFAVADNGIYFLSVRNREKETALEFYEFKAGKRKWLQEVGKPWFYGMAISPKQDSICYSIVDQVGSNLMLVDGMD
jgi:Tol biopolymer transport system component/DNA-binding winged helix-turn-helix (wHTH) protein